jgi:hypothetical protein
LGRLDAMPLRTEKAGIKVAGRNVTADKSCLR